MENPAVSNIKEKVKEKVESIFKGYSEARCSSKGCINQFCLNYLVNLSKNPAETEITDQEKLSAAVKLVKADPNIEVVEVWPPVPLDHKEIDALLSANDEKLFLSRVSEVFNNIFSLVSSFYPVENDSTKYSIKECSNKIDFIRLGKIYTELSRISESEEGVYEKIIKESIQNIGDFVVHHANDAHKHLSQVWVRIMIIWLAQEKLYDPMLEPITTEISLFFYTLEETKFWSRSDAEKFMSITEQDEYITIIKVNQQQLTFLLFEKPEEYSEEIEKVRKYFLILDFFYHASRLRKKFPISIKEFHSDIINREWEEDHPDIYVDWYKERRRIQDEEMDLGENDQVYEIDKKKGKFLYMMFPWALDASSKSRMMKFESTIQMKREIQNSIHNIFDILNNNIYLIVLIRRESLVEDALNSLVNAGKDLKKPLKVKFKDEPGIDEGGVQKEFFQLLVRELLDVEYGMFDYNTESNLYWIKKDTFESPLKFELIGIIIGLAIYNSNILDIHFPLAMYKKLLNREITLEDFAQYDPQVASSLKAILNYEKDDIAEAMSLTFTIQYESWGAQVEHELKDGGAQIQVTQENKEEYVQLYVDFLFNKSISKWFDSFKKGFYKCCHGEVLQMLEPEDLEMLVWGSQVLDFDELKRVTVYTDGYTEDSPVMIQFWEVISELTDDEKRKFLAFCTGWDRAPINGLGSMKFYISRHGDNQAMLPSVHTCFNHLLIPEYESKELLKEKLLKAINNSEGFGLM